METFESGDQSGDLENVDNENAHFPRVDTEKRKRHSLVSPLSRDFGLPTGLCNHERHVAATLICHRYTVVALKIRHVKFGNVYFLDEYLE